MSLADSLLVWWLRSGRYNWSRLHRQLFEGRYLNTILPSASSFSGIEALLKQVMWTMDGPLHLFDCVSYPQVTWAKKKDDCDGFSVLAAELLNKLDPEFKPVLLTVIVRPYRFSHTVCAFSSPRGGFMFFDNYILRDEGYQAYDDVVLIISRKAERVVCWDVRNPATLELIKFHKV
ncbi:hypothetical protein ACFLYL_02340 [Chloroflexota bacterium]